MALSYNELVMDSSIEETNLQKIHGLSIHHGTKYATIPKHSFICEGDAIKKYLKMQISDLGILSYAYGYANLNSETCNWQ